METPERIAGYRIEARIDASGPSQVFKALDRSGEPVALKLYPEGESDEVRARRIEALEKARAFDHPGLQRVFEVGEEDGRVYAVSEFVKGASLHEVMRHRKLPLGTCLRVIRKAAEALDYMIRKGGAPEGIGPTELLVHGEGRVVKVLEPGMPLTVVDDPRATATIHGVQSLRYLAPEKMSGKGGEDGPGVVYSLGVIGYEALTGATPVGRLKLPSAVDSDVPPEVDPVILKCLARNPAERYQTPGALVRDLVELEKHHGSLHAVGLSAGLRRWLLVGGVGVVLAVLAWLLLT